MVARLATGQIMKKFGVLFCASGLMLAGLHACSASSGAAQDGPLGNGGQANGSSIDGGFGANGLQFGGNGAGPFFGNGGGSNKALQDGACPVVKERPETVTKSTPVALFIMQDRSGSMVTGFPPPACSCSWDNATTAVTAFVNDPATAGIDIGMG